MVRASKLLTALTSETGVALADAVNAVAPGTAIACAPRLLAVNAGESGVANTLAFNVAAVARALEGSAILAGETSVALASAVVAGALATAILDAGLGGTVHTDEAFRADALLGDASTASRAVLGATLLTTSCSGPLSKALALAIKADAVVGAVGHAARLGAVSAAEATTADALASLTDTVVVTVAGAVGDAAIVSLPAANALAHAARSAVAVAIAVVHACGGTAHLASPAFAANTALGVVDGTNAVATARHDLAVGAGKALVASAAGGLSVEKAVSVAVHRLLTVIACKQKGCKWRARGGSWSDT